MEKESFEVTNAQLIATLFLACVCGLSNSDEKIYVTEPFGEIVAKSFDLYPDKRALADAIRDVWYDGMTYGDVEECAIRDSMEEFLAFYGMATLVTDSIFEPIMSFRASWEDSFEARLAERQSAERQAVD